MATSVPRGKGTAGTLDSNVSIFPQPLNALNTVGKMGLPFPRTGPCGDVLVLVTPTRGAPGHSMHCSRRESTTVLITVHATVAIPLKPIAIVQLPRSESKS